VVGAGKTAFGGTEDAKTVVGAGKLAFGGTENAKTVDGAGRKIEDANAHSAVRIGPRNGPLRTFGAVFVRIGHRMGIFVNFRAK